MIYSEDLIQYIWQNLLFNFSGLKTTDGDSVVIISPGILNTNSGPDFEQARIKINNTIIAGSVEIHVSGKEWVKHKHHLDVAYDSVILHVCYHQPICALRKDGSMAPSISLENKIDHNMLARYHHLMHSPFRLPCQTGLKTIKKLNMQNWLDRMAVERLESKSKVIEELLNKTTDWTQIAYAVLLRSFGSTVNSASFLALAQRLPFKIIAQHNDNLHDLEALLFGAAGLIEQEIEYSQSLAKRYALFEKKYTLQTTKVKVRMGRMRPQNLPTIRLAQLAALFHNHPSLPSRLLSIKTLEELKILCNVSPSFFWLTHYTFQSESESTPKQLSSPFIRHLFINCIIPLQYGYSKYKLQGLNTFDLEHLSALKAETNKITRTMVESGFENRNAMESQSLIELHNNYCVKKRCLNCNIGKEFIGQS